MGVAGRRRGKQLRSSYKNIQSIKSGNVINRITLNSNPSLHCHCSVISVTLIDNLAQLFKLFYHFPRHSHFLDVIKQISAPVHLAAGLLLHLRVQIQLWRIKTKVRLVVITGRGYGWGLVNDGIVVSIIQYFDSRVFGMVDSVFDNVDELWLCHGLQSQILTCRDEDISCLGNDQVNWSNLGMGETLLSASAGVGKVGEDQKWL